MVDLTIEPYAGEESLERIMRTLLGEDLSGVAKTQLDGRQYSADECFAAIAMLMQGNLPDQFMYVPLSVSQEYAEIYGEYATGSSQTLTSGSFIEIDPWSGQVNPTPNITPDFASDKITLDIEGMYHVGFQVSFKMPAGTLTNLHAHATLDSVVQAAVGCQRGIAADDALMNTMSSIGIVKSAAGQDLQLYVNSENATRAIQIFQSQLTVTRLGPRLA